MHWYFRSRFIRHWRDDLPGYKLHEAGIHIIRPARGRYKRGCFSSSRVDLNEACQHRFLFASLLRVCLTKELILSFLSLLLLVLFLLMDKLESRGSELGRNGSKKRAAVGTDEERPSKAARTGPLSGTRGLVKIPFLRRRVT